MNEPELAELYEAAARTSINRRCALAYLHDARGGMQALFSAIELLSRCVRTGASQLDRVERAHELAKRAIGNHESALLGAMQVLTAQPAAPASLELAELVREAARFLRTEASAKDLVLTVESDGRGFVFVERGRLYTLVVGLLNAAIDHTVARSTLNVTVSARGTEVLLDLGTDAGYVNRQFVPEWWHSPPIPPNPADLTLLFAHRVMGDYAGRLQRIEESAAGATLRLTFPRVEGAIAEPDPASGDR